MTTIKEVSVASIGEPYSVKIERNSKGYNYEVSVKGETADKTLTDVFAMRQRLEETLYGGDAPRPQSSSLST